MKPSGGKTSFISRGLDLLSKPIETPNTTAQTTPITLSSPSIQKVSEQNQPQKEFLRRQKVKKAVTVIRLKSKTRRLVELCEQITHSVRKSEAWFLKYERFFRSPVWKLVSDEAIRKAHFKCECWGCSRRAMQVYLLELPEEHLEPRFDWMARDNILIALCSHHHEIIHRFVMKKVVPLERPFDSRIAIDLPNSLPTVPSVLSVTASPIRG